MKRVMCVCLPQWPLQRLWHARPELRDRPVAIARPQAGKGNLILSCCPRALRAGVRSGMPVAEGHAVLPALSVHDQDEEKDVAALKKLAAWAERYSPIVGLEEGPGPQCLLLDVSGCADYFGGEDRLAQRAVREFRRHGWIVVTAIAASVGAAWGLANFAAIPKPEPDAPARDAPKLEPDAPARDAACGLAENPRAHVLPSDNQQPLLSLPVAALRLPEETLHTFAKLGIERVGQLQELPRTSLPGRFGPLVPLRLAQMLGEVPELIVPCQRRPEVVARCTFEYATDRRDCVNHAVEQLLERIVAMLGEQQRGARYVECWFYHETAAPHHIGIRLYRASRSPVHLRQLLRARLEPLRLAEPVCGLCLRVPLVEVVTDRQFELFDAAEPSELAVLVDQLVSRLGREAVTFPTLVPDPQPECACRFDPVVEGQAKDRRAARGEGRRSRKQNEVGARSASAARPLSLIPHPSPLSSSSPDVPWQFRRGDRAFTVTHAWGPERIETGWWRGQDIQRDYYIVETDTGARWWIFRRRDDNRWFVHGCFE